MDFGQMIATSMAIESQRLDELEELKRIEKRAAEIRRWHRLPRMVPESQNQPEPTQKVTS